MIRLRSRRKLDKMYNIRNDIATGHQLSEMTISQEDFDEIDRWAALSEIHDCMLANMDDITRGPRSPRPDYLIPLFFFFSFGVFDAAFYCLILATVKRNPIIAILCTPIVVLGIFVSRLGFRFDRKWCHTAGNLRR